MYLVRCTNCSQSPQIGRTRDLLLICYRLWLSKYNSHFAFSISHSAIRISTYTVHVSISCTMEADISLELNCNLSRTSFVHVPRPSLKSNITSNREIRSITSLYPIAHFTCRISHLTFRNLHMSQRFFML
jgi:hypothetical protein